MRDHIFRFTWECQKLVWSLFVLWTLNFRSPPCQASLLYLDYVCREGGQLLLSFMDYQARDAILSFSKPAFWFLLPFSALGYSRETANVCDSSSGCEEVRMIFLSVPGETDGAAKVGHGLHGGEGVGTTTFPGIRSGKIRDEKIHCKGAWFFPRIMGNSCWRKEASFCPHRALQSSPLAWRLGLSIRFPLFCYLIHRYWRNKPR